MFERLAGADFAYLTTTGRRSGKPHRIEIWFALHRGTIYLLSGGGDAADWVRNIRADRRVRVQIGSRTIRGTARFVRAKTEDTRARELLDAKYMGWRAGRPLSSWARGALPVAIATPSAPRGQSAPRAPAAGSGRGRSTRPTRATRDRSLARDGR